jgi:hypothetical protein
MNQNANYIKDLRIRGFTDAAIILISKGFERGLSEDQVRMYANPTFNFRQMQQIFNSCCNKLPADQIMIFADPKYDAGQMTIIRHAFLDGLTSDQVRTFADPSISANDMRDMRMKLEEQNAHKHEVQPERTSVRVKPPVQRTGKSR